MTRQEFVDKWKHQLGGMVLDGATSQLRGADLSLWIRAILRKTDVLIAQMYDDVTKPPPANGHAAQPQRKVTVQ